MTPLPKPQSQGTSAAPEPQLGFNFAAETAAAPPRIALPPWKVCELVTEIRNHVEREYRDIRVEGEISNLRKAASGHLYFTLKDDRSQLPVVIFRARARLLGFDLKDGLEVQARGAVSVYEDRGQLQLVAESVEPRGKGSLQVAYEQLYARLKEEGLFESARKRPLPLYPRSVGVITSPRGAVIHDIRNILARRQARLQVLLYPVSVQGDSAIGEIVEAFDWFRRNGGVDVLILARGGGSLEDLAAFNSEPVARAIANSPAPVVSAVGHETDFTIADFVADLRAPTPSAAAELVTDAQYRIEDHLASLLSRLERATRYQRMQARERLARLDAGAVLARVEHGLARRQQRLDELRFRLDSGWEKLLAAAGQRVDRLRARLMQQDVSRRLAQSRERLRTLQVGLLLASGSAMERRRARWIRAQDRLLALSPLAVLERGYALVYCSDGDLVKDASQLRPEDTVRMRFARGRAAARVIEVSTDNGKNG